MPKEGFDSITVKKELLKYFDALNKTEPYRNRQSFFAELLKFWSKYHCPECGYETVVKEKHHKC